MTGNIPECIRLLESFQSRKDMLYPVSLALLYFHSRAPTQDADTIDGLNSELAIAEDVTVCHALNFSLSFSVVLNCSELLSPVN